MKLKIRDMEAKTDKVVENSFLNLLETLAELVNKTRINYFNRLDLSI